MVKIDMERNRVILSVQTVCVYSINSTFYYDLSWKKSKSPLEMRYPTLAK